MEIEKVKKATINDLLSIIDGIKNIQFEEKLSYKFNTKELQNDHYRENFLNNIKKQINHNKYKYIYTFSLPDNFATDIVYSRYKITKESKKSERAYARLNTKSPCLYVGSSKGLIPRIKQHLGFGPKGTYAMQLCYWCENLNLDITLNLYAFDNGISIKAFQAFEDGAWNSLRPMLGRQGKK
ncbi:MAG: GIY-YIG nuclease family protein [Bacteroidetes bacterium]|nr:GIY-YIG nuclease family protein [Bacteroidota bacterium]